MNYFRESLYLERHLYKKGDFPFQFYEEEELFFQESINYNTTN